MIKEKAGKGKTLYETIKFLHVVNIFKLKS